MNSNRTRIISLLTVAVVAVGLFLILKPGDDTEDDSTSEATPAKVSTPSQEPSSPTPVKPKPVIPQVNFEGGEPAGGVLTVEAKEGETIAFKVRSDVSEEIHVHGYDISREVGPQQAVTLKFPASLVGIYEVEMEGGGIPIAELEITP